MKFTLPSRNEVSYASLEWYESEVIRGVRFGIRKISLAQRMELTEKTRELLLHHEFLRGGNSTDQIEVALGELMVRRLYVQWGLEAIEKLTIDGQPATVELLIEKGPEALTQEIARVIRDSLDLTQEERKNS